MNVSIAWTVFAFLAGGIVGGLIADHFLGKVYKQSLALARKENQRLSDDLNSSIAKRMAVLAETEEKLDENLRTVGKPRRIDYSKINPRVKNVDLRELARKYADPDADNEFLIRPSIEDYLAENDGPKDDTELRDPFEITAEQFEEEYGADGCAIISFYQEDGTLVDERDVIILEPKELVGEDGLEKLSETKESCLYFRCDALDKSFEVDVLHEQSYRRDVLCIDDSEDGLAKDDE